MDISVIFNLVVMNGAGVNIYVKVFVSTFAFIFLGYIYLRVKLLFHMVTLFNFWRNDQLFSKATVQEIFLPATYKGVKGSNSFMCLPTIILVGVKWYLTVVLICIFWQIMMWSYLFTCLWPFVYVLGRNIHSDILTISILGYFLLLSCKKSIYLDTSSLSNIGF